MSEIAGHSLDDVMALLGKMLRSSTYMGLSLTTEDERMLDGLADALPKLVRDSELIEWMDSKKESIPASKRYNNYGLPEWEWRLVFQAPEAAMRFALRRGVKYEPPHIRQLLHNLKVQESYK